MGRIIPALPKNDRERTFARELCRRRIAGALYALACLLPAATFAVVIVLAWRGQ
jgi:hypothetical protein